MLELRLEKWRAVQVCSLKRRWLCTRYPSCIPKQENGCDCGVFSLMFAEHLARGADDFEFQQVDMEYFRVMITAAIMDLKLISHFQ